MQCAVSNVCRQELGVGRLLVHNFYTCILLVRGVECLLCEYDVVASYMKTHPIFRSLSAPREWVALQILLLNNPSIRTGYMEV